jgi:hypothetical protein
MRHSHLAWIAAAACLVGACASGGDSDNGEELGEDSGPIAVEASAEAAHDSGSLAMDSSQPRNDSAAGVPDSSSNAMDSATKEDSAPKDSGSVPDTGTPATDSGPPPGVCPNDAKYGIEAAADVFSGNFTLCLLGAVCAAGQCCYEELNPGNVCVAL